MSRACIDFHGAQRGERIGPEPHDNSKATPAALNKVPWGSGAIVLDELEPLLRRVRQRLALGWGASLGMFASGAGADLDTGPRGPTVRP